jgi:hypothetical protein
MEAVSTSETLVSFYETTLRYISENTFVGGSSLILCWYFQMRFISITTLVVAFAIITCSTESADLLESIKMLMHLYLGIKVPSNSKIRSWKERMLLTQLEYHVLFSFLSECFCVLVSSFYSSR